MDERGQAVQTRSSQSSQTWAQTAKDSAATQAPLAESTLTERTVNDLPVSTPPASLPSGHSYFPDSPHDFAGYQNQVGSPATPLYSPPIDLALAPFLYPQQSNVYQARLLHYNKLVSPARGGGVQSSGLQPSFATGQGQAGGARSRSSSKVSQKDGTTGKGVSGGGHGSKLHSENKRPGVNTKDTSKMGSKHGESAPRGIPSQRINASSQAQGHSSSVPSTPHQHARQFSFESREPSPNADKGHSPRSAFSEITGNVPSLRPLPPRLGGCRYETAQQGSRRRMAYKLGGDRLPRSDLKTIKDKLSQEEEAKLATDMREIYDRLLPTPKVEEKRRQLVQKLEKLFNDEWPGQDIKVQMFGSSGNLLCSDDSDVDICITTPGKELEVVCVIAELLARRGMEKVICINAAKVPIVKIWDPELGLACDMNVNNTVALENTRMVRVYVEIDPRVRQLAMIIKYWTRRRQVNDAGIGGTLSSYTWICLIVAFLQLRSPSVLPALHQLPYKMPRPDGQTSEFADNFKRLNKHGRQNTSSEAELLFQFFRFYAHEFDYEKHVLSIRTGEQLLKESKGWHLSLNNMLCVEEPFNTVRNLGNTADDISFRGLHLELRRAFELISNAQLDKACEAFVFPKEEVPQIPRPSNQPRPVMLRSASQTQSNRGNRGGHRGGRSNFHRGGAGGAAGGSNRRSSSSVPAYDPSTFFLPPMTMQPPQGDMSWYQTPNPQFTAYQYGHGQQDYLAQVALQQENLRQLHLSFQQQSAYMAQHQQGTGSTRANSTASGQQPPDRSRTNSFDQVPLANSIRPDIYAMYGLSLGHAYYPQSAYATFPASPASTANTPSASAQEFRRPLQRSSAASEGGGGTNSAHRSQSQPASRSQNGQGQFPGYHAGGTATPIPTGTTARSIHGLPIPNFRADESDVEENPRGVKSASPLSEEGKEAAPRTQSPTRQAPAAHNMGGSIAFGDLAAESASPSPRRRRVSTELPQSVLDRRMRRQSRSPSPMGHSRAYSVGTSPTPLVTTSANSSQPSRPLIVNGSGLKVNVVAAAAASGAVVLPPDERQQPPLLDNPLQAAEVKPAAPPQQLQGPPLVVNGTNMKSPAAMGDSSFRDRIANLNASNLARGASQADAPPSTTMRQRFLMSQQPQSGVIAPLDLAINEHTAPILSLAHLSPVYEGQTPSPTATRRLEMPRTDTGSPLKSVTGDPTKPSRLSTAEGQKPGASTAQLRPIPVGTTSSAPRSNGHIRGKSDSEGVWQKAGKSKKKTSTVQGNAEPAPRVESERKGG